MMTKRQDQTDFLDFLNYSPTAWHAVENIAKILLKNGFQELQEKENWKLEPGQSYFTTRNGSSLIGFKVPSNEPERLLLAASHTDSPALKLRPHPEFIQDNMVMLGVEVYGGPLLSSWLNRDLGIAGRIFYLDAHDHFHEALVNLSENPVIIPQLAIHLDRQVNENGLVLNKQEHLSALAGLKIDEREAHLHALIKTQIDFKKILGEELFLYPLQKAAITGFEHEFIASYRIDSLASVYAIMEGFCSAQSTSLDLKMAAFWDNEEVGSETSQGANSSFFMHILERICLALDYNRESLLRLLPNSLCLSVDLAHALHPNHREKHDPRHKIHLGKGLVIKSNSQQRYATSAYSCALVTAMCDQLNLPVQHFSSRGDIPCGTTIGPIHAHLSGMPTADIGIAQLSMHSSRELISIKDQNDMRKLIAHFYQDS